MTTMSDAEWDALAAEMRSAAETLEKVSAIYGYSHADCVVWSALELRMEAVTVSRSQQVTNEKGISE